MVLLSPQEMENWKELFMFISTGTLLRIFFPLLFGCECVWTLCCPSRSVEEECAPSNVELQVGSKNKWMNETQVTIDNCLVKDVYGFITTWVLIFVTLLRSSASLLWSVIAHFWTKPNHTNKWCRVWLEVKHKWNFQAERAVKDYFSEWYYSLNKVLNNLVPPHDDHVYHRSIRLLRSPEQGLLIVPY